MAQMTPNEMAAQFADDARALRSRADALAGKPGRAVGPGAQASRAMADACDVVAALCAVAGSDAASVTELHRMLDQRLAAEREPQARHVYAGALERLQAAARADGGDDDDLDDLDDDDLDDDVDDELFDEANGHGPH
jgi:hypothetical protein